MAIFASELIGIGQEDLVSSATAAHKIGTRAVSDDGRVFRYAKAGATLVAGNVLQGPPVIAHHLATTATATAIGARSLVFTPAGTGAAAGYYNDGYLTVDTGPGDGYTYSVESNPAITASVAFTLKLKDPVQVAFSTASRLGLIANPYSGVIQMPATTATGTLAGVATYIITSGQYGWVQTWGVASVLCAGTPALGAIVMAPGAVAGAAEIIVAAANLVVAQVIGNMAQVGVNAKNCACYLKISP